MAALKKKLGRCDCPICKKIGVVMLKLNDAGTVTWACDDCDSVGFAKAGTDGADILRRKVGAPAPVKPVPGTPVPGTPVPIKRKPATPFDFLGA